MKPFSASHPGLSASWTNRFILGGLSLFVILTFWPLLKTTFFPWHDTLYGFELFHYFYSQFFFHGDIANWLAYDSFGLPANHDQLFGLSLLNYLVMGLGKIFRVTDALWLFKVSVLGELLFFLLGMFLLSSQLFKSRKTVFLVCLLALSRSHLLSQLYFDFRIYYLFPLTAYFLVMFFRRKRTGFLWLAGLVLFAWELGNVLYFIFLWILLFTVFAIVYCVKDTRIWRSVLKMTVGEWIVLITLLVVAGAFFSHLKSLRAFIDLAPRGPDGKAALSNYIHWGGVHDLGAILRWHLLGKVPERFVGLWPLAFLGLAVVRVRARDFAAFLTLFVLLLWLSFGGVFSALCYYLPGVGFYRHIGLTYGLSKVLLAVCAGFGLDRFWRMDLKRKMFFMGVVGLGLIFVADALRISGGWFTDLAFNQTAQADFWTGIRTGPEISRLAAYVLTVGVLVLCLGLACLLSRSSAARGRWVTGGVHVLIVVCVCFDVLTFQVVTDTRAWELPEKYQRALFTRHVHAPEYQAARSNKPLTTRQQDAYALANRPSIDAVYTSAYNFIQMDPCHSEFFTHMYSLGFSRLLKTRKALDQDLLMTLGCRTPKIRLVPDGVFVRDVPEGMAVMERMPRLFDTVVLTGTGGEVYPPYGQQQVLAYRPAQVRLFTANEIEFTIQVPYQNGAWLVYADSYHPGWRGFVDGKPVKVFPAYLAFKAVRVEQGEHAIRFVFSPAAGKARSVFFALFGGLCALLLLGAYVVVFMTGKAKIL